jgi:serine/threonine protein kinase
MKELGKGAFGEVFLCRHMETNQHYAMKVVSRSGSAANISHEISIMEQLDHENIVALIEVIDDPSSSKIYLIQELMGGGPLMPDDETVTPIEEGLAKKYFRDILHGVCYLHAGGK